MELKIHHVGYAVSDIAEAIEAFEFLGYEQQCNICHDPDRNIDIVFMVNGENVVELVSPNSAPNSVEGVLSKVGPSAYHICYCVDNILEAIQLLKSRSWIVVQKPAKATAINNAPVAFLYNKYVGLIELVEQKKV